MIFLVSMIFIVLFYVIPLSAFLVDQPPVFPVLGHEGSWLLSATLIYSLMALAALTLTRFEDVLWPSLPALLRRIVRRTGIYRIDSFGWRFSLLAAILFIPTDPTLVPLGVAGALGFGSVARQKVVARRVKLDNSDSARVATADAEAAVVRVYEWSLQGPDGSVIDNRVELPIAKGRYEEFAQANPANQGVTGTHHYRRLVNEGMTQEVTGLAAEVRNIAHGRSFNSYQELSLLLALVQSVPSAPDDETKGRRYTRWPIETLYENVGDSECKAVLLAALCKALGYPAVIVELGGRTAVGVGGADGVPGRFLKYQGNKYYFCEPTAPGCRVGQVPADLTSEQLWVFGLDERDEAA